MSVDTTGDIGLEVIQNESWVVMVRNINAAVDAQNLRGGDTDDYLDTVRAEMGLDTPLPVLLESVDLNNIFNGHKPSLIQAPVSMIPNVSVMADRADPSPENPSDDHMSSYLDRLRVEIMVKAGDEDMVNKRVHRFVNAVNAVLMGNRSLNGKVTEISDAPRVFVTDVFPRQEEVSYGSQWFWQGARIDYAVEKKATLQRSSAGTFLAGVGADIDQAP